MSDFFTRLAERTLGLALSIQPFKSSLFAPEPDAIPEIPFVEVEAEWSGVEGLGPVHDRGLAGANLSRPSPMYRPDTETPQLYPAFAQTPAPAHNPKTSTVVGAESAWGEVENLVPAHDGELPPTKLSANGPLSQANLRQSPEQHRRLSPTAESFSTPSSTTQEFPSLTGTIELVAQHTIISQTHSSLYHESLPFQRIESDPSSNISTINKESAAILPTQMSIKQMSEGAGEAEKGVVGLYGRKSGGLLRPWEEGGPLLRTSTPPSQAQLETSIPESTIQVTIGRVEVRAVTAPTTTTRSQQQPARPSAMSLDEYLRRQEQGGRR
jgi:hypothetical protein